MSTYQVKTYFDWGGLKFEPYQRIEIHNTDQSNVVWVYREKTDEGFFASTKAFQVQLELGNIASA